MKGWGRKEKSVQCTDEIIEKRTYFRINFLIKVLFLYFEQKNCILFDAILTAFPAYLAVWLFS